MLGGTTYVDQIEDPSNLPAAPLPNFYSASPPPIDLQITMKKSKRKSYVQGRQQPWPVLHFLDLPSELRVSIYRSVFTSFNGEIFGLSRASSVGSYDDNQASTESLIYNNNDQDRAISTSASFLRTCRIINTEATPIFYAQNKIVLHAEDNNDIFYWFLDIGEENRRRIRDLDINWAYGVSVDSAQRHVHSLIDRIVEIQDLADEAIEKQCVQLIRAVQKLETKTVRLIRRTLQLLAVNQELNSLAVYLPGIDAGDIWDLPNDNLFFAEEIFSNSTASVYACIPEALRKIMGIKKLTIGYTRDFELAEEVAQCVGAQEVVVRVRPEGTWVGLSCEEQGQWLSKGWRVEGAMMHKIRGSAER
ncbi:MAG: hypothetical protein MMC33_009575 [Icmadophila ericetorum]|nr:hypothetical protein [Icmadophila ericetorum]